MEPPKTIALRAHQSIDRLRCCQQSAESNQAAARAKMDMSMMDMQIAFYAMLPARHASGINISARNVKRNHTES